MEVCSRGIGKRPWLVVGALVIACLLPSVAAAKPAPKPPSYKVEVTFNQTRLWTYYLQQVGPECTSTTEGNGSDTATLKGKATFNLQPQRRGFAGFGAKGTHSRVGTQTFTTGTPNFPGADCGGPPSTTIEPVTGCGPKPTLVNFGAVQLVGKKVFLEWDSSSVPDFVACPYFGGANEASSANALPGAEYRDDPIATLNRKALLTAKHRVSASDTAEISRVETCANLVQPCPEGTTYNGTGSVKTEVKFVFTPKKR